MRKTKIPSKKSSLYPLKRAEKSTPLKSSRYFKTSHKSARYNFVFPEIRHSRERERLSTLVNSQFFITFRYFPSSDTPATCLDSLCDSKPYPIFSSTTTLYTPPFAQHQAPNWNSRFTQAKLTSSIVSKAEGL